MHFYKHWSGKKASQAWVNELLVTYYLQFGRKMIRIKSNRDYAILVLSITGVCLLYYSFWVIGLPFVSENYFPLASRWWEINNLFLNPTFNSVCGKGLCFPHVWIIQFLILELEDYFWNKIKYPCQSHSMSLYEFNFE